MKKYVPILQGTQMFSGVKTEEVEAMLSCLGARSRFTKKASM